ncbi:MAG: AAA family ATPase [Verrucomicrobiota bacterium]
MKILKVTLLNLNSLKGENSIDFENGLLGEAGIFAITGPTGSGKSTILDAITLALFGKAARYENEKPEEMMTRGTGECSAEVLFECKEGRYRAKWQLARAHKKPDGKVQSMKREISEHGSGDILAEKVREADDLVEELTGLNYMRFLRSVLLAQGHFKEFLDASDKDRGELLEKITGTEIYSDIGKKAYQIQSEKNAEITLARQLMEGLELKSEDELGILRQEKKEKKKILSDLEAAQTELTGKIKASEDFIKQGQSLVGLQQGLAQWKVEESAFEVERGRLLRHEATLSFHAAWLQLESHKNEREKLRQQVGRLAEENKQQQEHAGGLLVATADFVKLELETRRAGLTELELSQEKNSELKVQLDDWLQSHVDDKNLDKVLQAIRPLGESIRSGERERSSLQGRLQQLVQEARQAEGNLAERASAQDTAKAAVKIAGEQAEKARSDFEQLSDGYGIQHWRGLVAEQRTRGEQARHVKILREQWVGKNEQYEQLKQGLPELSEAHQQARLKYEQQQERLENEQAVLEDKERIFQQALKIASFDEHRADLKEGEACPLCGAQDHPYGGEIGHSENLDRKARDDQNNVLAQASAELDEQSKKAIEAGKDFKYGQERLDDLQQALQQEVVRFEAGAKALAYEGGIDTQEIFEQWMAVLEEAGGAVGKKLSQLEQLDEGQRKSVEFSKKQQADLRVMATEVQSLQQAKSKLAQEQQNLGEGITLCEGEIAKQVERFNQELGKFAEPISLAGETKDRADVLEERYSVYQAQVKQRETCQQDGEELKRQLLSLTDEIKRLEDELKIWRSELGKLELVGQSRGVDGQISGDGAERRKRCEEAGDAVNRSAHLLEQKRKDEQGRKEAVLADTAALETALQGSAFSSIGELITARLEQEQLSELMQKAEDLAHRRTRLQAQIEQIEKELRKLEQLSRVDEDEITVLKSELADQNEQQAQLNQGIGEIDLLLQQDKEARASQVGQIEKIERLTEDARSWVELNSLIGSATGDTFSKYAQGLTLTQLLSLANRHLVDLNDRYQIQRASDSDLGLVIVDLYQGDAVRPTRSLSGGESFLISLALALGLSDLAGSETRIESLFIDEGFGTLDTDTLDIALAALENLRLSNRTIGIISHVDALKQRIGAQIQVSKSSNGYGDLRIVG